VRRRSPRFGTEMTAVLQLLQDIARHLEVNTTVTAEQLHDLMKKTELRHLTHRMEELAEPGAVGPPSAMRKWRRHARRRPEWPPLRRRHVHGLAFASLACVLESMPLSWSELARRTWREAVDDDVLGLAAQLSYYFFLALFPAILFLLALASFFPLSNLTDDIGSSLGPFVSSQVLALIQEQMRRLANNENGGLLTVGAGGALWSGSAALVSIVGALIAPTTSRKAGHGGRCA
jgi:hypothetical protein